MGWGLRPFQEYFTYIEPIVHQRWAKTGTPGGKHLPIRKQNLAFPINVAIFYKEAYISDVLAKWEIILFLVSKCTILGSKDAKVEGVSLFKKLTCDHQSWNTFARETIATIKMLNCYISVGITLLTNAGQKW